MASRSRRQAREAALRSLYEIELSHGVPLEALQASAAEMELPDDQLSFARRLVFGVLEHQVEIDNGLSKLIQDYDYDRIAAIDRTVLRIAAYELMREPSISPKVTINEAIEIAKRYSTAESGKFVNGVLGAFVKGTVKAHWDPATAPSESAEDTPPELPIELEEVEVEEDSDAAKTAKRFGAWTIRE